MGVFRSSWCDDVLFIKLGFQTRENCESTGPQAECFYCFTVLEELLNRAPGIKENGNIDEFFTRRQVCCYEKLYCYGDLSFQTQRVLVKLVIRRVLLIIL